MSDLQASVAIPSNTLTQELPTVITPLPLPIPAPSVVMAPPARVSPPTVEGRAFMEGPAITVADGQAYRLFKGLAKFKVDYSNAVKVLTNDKVSPDYPTSDPVHIEPALPMPSSVWSYGAGTFDGLAQGYVCVTNIPAQVEGMVQRLVPTGYIVSAGCGATSSTSGADVTVWLGSS